MSDEQITPAQAQPEAPQSTEPETPEEPTKSGPWADPEAARREIEKLRKESASYRTKAKELEPLAEKARQAEEAQKTEAERLTGRLTEAQERLTAARQRAVRSEVKALAASSFADPEDAHAFLDLGGYVTDDGDVDASAIERDLAGLLERKPHLAKPPADTGPRRPAPDRTQGSSGNGARTSTDPGQQFQAFITDALKRR